MRRWWLVIAASAPFAARANSDSGGCAGTAACDDSDVAAPRLVRPLAGVVGHAGDLGNGGPALYAYLRQPGGVAVDVTARQLFVVESGNHAVRLVELANRTIALVAGVLGAYGPTGYGVAATHEQLNSPVGASLDAQQRRLYVADTGNHVIRELDLLTGTLSTVAGVLGSPGRSGDGGPASSAQLFAPRGVAVDPAAKRLYVADTNNHGIRAVDLSTGLLSTVAGVLGSGGFAGDDSPVSITLLHFPYNVEVDALAPRLYVAEPYNHLVRLVDLATGTVSTVAGVPFSRGWSGDGGPATWGQLHFPCDISLDLTARQLYIADAGNHAIRMVDLVTGSLATVAGGPPREDEPVAQMQWPCAVALDARARILYVADRVNHAVWTVDLATRSISTPVGTLGTSGSWGDGGPVDAAKLHSPRGVALDTAGGRLFVADTSNHVVHSLDVVSGAVSTVVGVNCPFGYGPDHALDIPGRYTWPVHPAKVLWGTPVRGNCEGNESSGDATITRLRSPYGVAVDPVSEQLYIADTGNHVVRRADVRPNATGLETVAGVLGSKGLEGDGGQAVEAQLHSPSGVAVDPAAKHLYIADAGNHAVRLLDLDNGTLSTIAGTLGARGSLGDDGPASAARLDQPHGVAVDPAGKLLYVADTYNHAVRVVDLSTGRISRVAGISRSGGLLGDGGSALAAQLRFPTAVAVAAAAQQLFIADNWNHAVRLVDLVTGLITVVAGVLGVRGTTGDFGPAIVAQLHAPAGVTCDAEGRHLYIADSSNHAVRLAALSNDLRDRGATP